MGFGITRARRSGYGGIEMAVRERSAEDQVKIVEALARDAGNVLALAAWIVTMQKKHDEALQDNEADGLVYALDSIAGEIESEVGGAE
jgi:hypothetical protein